MDIEIKKDDYGVSWAIKRQLQEEGVNIKNINSCWTEIMNAFQGDKESKVNNQTIGEKWTSFKAVVECAVGQVIHIAEATWTKIKEAVTKAAGKTTETKDTKGSTDKKSGNVTETVTKQDCRETDATKSCRIWYCERTGKHYKEVDGKMEEMKAYYPGGRILRVDADGTTYQTNPGADNSTWTTKVSKDNKPLADTRRDAKVNILCTIEYYDANEKKTKIKTLYSNGKQDHTFWYDENGTVTKRRNHKFGETVTYRYLPDGSYISERKPDKGQVSYTRNFKDDSWYKCDKDGKMLPGETLHKE